MANKFSVGDTVRVKATNKKGKAVGQKGGMWEVEFPNKSKSLYPTNKISLTS